AAIFVTVNTVSTPPSIRCSANPPTVTEGGSVSLTAVASSPEGRSLTYSWSTSSGSITGTGSSVTLNTGNVTAGTVNVTCGAADSQGLKASATVTVTVNTPPPTISCSGNPSSITAGGTAVISAGANSPEGRPLTYTWIASAGKLTGSGSSV